MTSISDIAEDDDPVLGAFLGFLARDIASHPERLQIVDARFAHPLFLAQIETLAQHVPQDAGKRSPAG